MDGSVLITALALGFEVLGACVVAVWAVAKIKATTDTLTSSISQLSKSVEKLETSLDRHEEKQIDHEIRLQMLERPQIVGSN